MLPCALCVLPAFLHTVVTLTDTGFTCADSVARATGASAVVVFDSTLVEVEENGRGHFRRHMLTKFYRQDSARSARVQRFDYDPRANDHFLTRAVIHHGGSTSDTLNVPTSVDAEAPADGIYWGARMRLYDMGMIRPGDALEVWSYRIGYQIAYLAEQGAETRFVPPQEGEFYDVVVFGGAAPILSKVYRLRMPRSKPVQYAEYNGKLRDAVRFEGDVLTYVWSADHLNAITDEPFSAELSDFAPKVVLSTLEDWPARARWFHETNENQFNATDAMAAAAAEITAGLSRDEDRFLALQQWVATHIRYSGLSMGEGEGYTLHPADMIYTERSGVCKDMAGMLIALLRAEGYETYPVMTMAGARVEEVPADQFNHCVVAVRRADGSFFMLDPTWCAYSRYHWSRAEGEQHYVIGCPEGGSLLQQPLFRDDNRVAWRLTAALSERGDLSGVLAFQPSGNYDTNYRRQLAYRTPAEREALYASYLKGLGPSVTVSRVDHSDPDDLGTPFRLSVHFEAPGYALPGNNSLAFTSPLLAVLTDGARLASVVRYAREAARTNPALIWYTRWEEAEEKLSLPKGFVVHGADSSVTFTQGPVAVSARCEHTDREFRTTVEMRIDDRYLEPAEFRAIAEAAARLKRLTAQPIVCRQRRMD